jgi:hypothetical protein
MKTFLPVLAAGGTFAAAAIAGLIGGILLANQARQPLLAPVGLLLGAAIGGYSAVRVLLRSIR